MPEADFTHRNEFSVQLLTPKTEEAEDWVNENIPEDAMYFGDALAIESRYFDSIAEGIIEDGLTIVTGG